MSKTFAVQSADGIVGLRGPNQSFLAISNKTAPRYDATTGVPQNAVSGFITGALVINPFGSAGTLLYINIGTVTSATWQAIA